MPKRALPLLLLSLPLLAPTARADSSLTGVCPDGSAFIVQDRAQVPCARARFVESSEMPPLRPEYLPKPYGWLVDQQLRNPNNPYELVETGRKIREAHAPAPSPAGEAAHSEPGAASAVTPASETIPPAAEPARSVQLSLGDADLRDLVEVIALRQELAPAEFLVRDALGAETLRVQLAHSAAFETRVLEATGRPASEWRVVVFAANALAAGEFRPNFFVVQDGATFRPDPADPGEVGMLLGEPGALEQGTVAVGYFAFPARFDPARNLEIYWNDRSIDVALRGES
jgi:hypothetical protein